MQHNRARRKRPDAAQDLIRRVILTMAVPEPARGKVGCFPTQAIFVPSGSPMGGEGLLSDLNFACLAFFLLEEATILALEGTGWGDRL